MFNEDLSLFFSNKEHAVVGVWQSQHVDLIFEKPHTEILGMNSANPTALVPVASMPNVANGQTILIASINYKIQNIEPDGTGLMLLQLTKA